MMIDFRTKDTKTTIISGYQPFYIQKHGGSLIDTRTQWGMVAKTNPYPVLPTPKEPYNNDWKDEDGADEYNAEMYYEPIEFSVSFYVKAYATVSNTAAEVLRLWLLSFFDYVREGEFRTYDSYTGIGYRKVRFNGYDEDKFKARSNWACAVVTVKFKANDPTTQVFLSDDNILPVYYGTSSTGASTANKVVSISDFSLTTGVQVAVHFNYSDTTGVAKLNVSSTGAIFILHAPAERLKNVGYYLFEYDGTYWDCKGEL